MRPRQNLASRLFSMAFLLLKKQTPPRPGKQHAQLWHGNLSFCFPFFRKGTDTSILSSFVSCALILKGQSRTPRPKSGEKKGTAGKCFWVRREPFLMMEEDVPVEMLGETLCCGVNPLYLSSLGCWNSATLNDFIEIRNDFVPNEKHASLPSLWFCLASLTTYRRGSHNLQRAFES